METEVITITNGVSSGGRGEFLGRVGFLQMLAIHRVGWAVLPARALLVDFAAGARCTVCVPGCLGTRHLFLLLDREHIKQETGEQQIMNTTLWSELLDE